MADRSTIDTDIFATYYDKGLKSGTSGSTIFSSFFEGLIGGIDAQQKYNQNEATLKGTEQQNEIRQNDIDNIPLTNQIKQQTVDKGEAELTAYNTPQAVELRQQTQENSLNKARQQAQYDKQHTAFINIMQGDNATEKADAILDGRFTDLFAISPELREKGVEGSITKWPPEKQAQWNEQERQKRNTKYQERIAPKLEQEVQSAIDAMEIDPSVSHLKQIYMDQFKDDKEADVSFLEKGRVGSYIDTPKVLMPVMENGKPKKGEDGKIITELVTSPLDISKAKSYKTFYIGDEPVLDKTGRPVELDADTINTLTRGQRAYNFTNKIGIGRGGPTDINKNIEDTNKAKEEIAAKNAGSEQEIRERVATFNANVKPNYRKEADVIVADAAEKKAKRDAEVKASQPTPVPTNTTTPVPVYSSTPLSSSSPVIMPTTTPFPTVSAGSNSVTTTVTPTPAPTLVATVWPERTQDVPKKTPTAVTPTRSQTMQDMALAKARIKVDAAQQLKGVEPSASNKVNAVEDIPLSAAPNKLAVIPEMKVKVSYAHDQAAIDIIKTDPIAGNLSALAQAAMTQESRGNPNAVSRTNTKGWMQMTGPTGKGVLKGYNATNPIDSAYGGAVYLESLINMKAFKGNPMIALTAYNAGPGVTKTMVAMAGSTDWNVFKDSIERAILEYPKWNDEGLTTRKQVIAKAKESREYAERVIANFPAFVSTNKDRAIAKRLSEQGILEIS